MDEELGYISDCRDDDGNLLSLRKGFHKFVHSTTLHGVGRLSEGGGYIRRFVWGLLFCTGLFFMIYVSKGLIGDYVSYSKNTVTSYKHHSELSMGDITICGQAGVHQFDLPPLHYNLPGYADRLGSVLRWSWGSHQADSSGWLKGLRWQEKWIKKAPTSAHDELNTPVHSAKSTRCYLLNISHSKLPPAIVPGFATSLNVIIDLAMWNWTNSSSPFHKKPIPYTAGASIDVTDPSSIPLPPDHGVACSVGGECKVAVAKRELRRLGDGTGNAVFGNCTPPKGNPYSVTDCKARCLAKGVSKCRSKLAANGISFKDLAIQHGIVKEQEEHGYKCLESIRCDHCYPPCVEIDWKMKHAFMPFREHLQVEEWIEYQHLHQLNLKSSTTPAILDINSGQMRALTCAKHKTCSFKDVREYMLQNLVAFSVYPETLTVSKTKESPKVELETLISALGGNIGLFIGASYMTLFEWLEFCGVLAMVYTCFSAVRRNRAGDASPLLGESASQV